MFGWGELGLIVVLAVILLGPDKLPEVARQLGKIYAEYQKAKRRLELEILYSVEPPNKEFLDKIYEKNLSEAIKKEVEVAMVEDAKQVTREMTGENNLNIQDEGNVKESTRGEKEEKGNEKKEKGERG